MIIVKFQYVGFNFLESSENPQDKMATSSPPIRLPHPKPDHNSTRPPNSKLGVFFWKRRMWFESTFVLSMLEPWEKILLREF